MNKNLSTPIKIVAFLFIASGLINIGLSIVNLTAPTIQIDSQGFQGFVSELVSYFGIGFGLLDILIGWSLIKLKHWAYIVGLMLTIITLGMHIFTLAELSTTKYISLASSLVILILLIIGRKNFNDAK